MWKLVFLSIVLILATIVGVALYEHQKSGTHVLRETNRVISLPWLIPRTQGALAEDSQKVPTAPPAEPLFTPLPQSNLGPKILREDQDATQPNRSQADETLGAVPESQEFPRQDLAISPTAPQPPVTQPSVTQPSTQQKTAANPESQRKISGDFVNGTMKLGKEIDKNGFHKNEPVVVIVDKGSHYTYVLQKQAKDNVVKVLSISNAIGKDSTPTPYGRFWVADKTKWPSWVPPKSIDPEQKAIHPYNKDRKNPLGVARVRLNKWDIALHGTNSPRSIRQDVSHGCIRHSNQDIMKLYNMVKVGTPVYITEGFAGTTLKRSDFDITKSSW